MNPRKLFFLLGVVVCCCGFSWGKSAEQKCGEAKNLIAQQMLTDKGTLSDDTIRTVQNLCAQGAGMEFIRGFQQEQKKEIQDALHHYEKARTLDPHFADAYGRAGLLCAVQGNDTSAVPLLTQALEEGARNTRYRAVLAGLLLKSKQYLLARYHYSQIPDAEQTGNKDVLKGIAEAYHGEGHYSEADTAYRRALKLSPQSTELLSGFADVLINEKQLEEAIRTLTELLKHAPDSKEVHKKLADAYMAIGDKARAERELNHIGVKQPTTADTLVREGDAHFLKREFPAATRSYLAASEQVNPAVDIFQKLGDAYSAVGNDDDALKSYRRALMQLPNDPGTHYSIGVILERKGNLDEAIVAYERVITLEPTNGDARRRLAEIYTLRGNLTKAIATYQAILALKADNPVIHFKLARVFEKANKYAEAVQSFETAIKLDPTNLEPRRQLALLHTRRRRYADAEKQYREILASNRDDLKGRYGMISSLGRQKKYRELVEFLSQETERYPDDALSFYRLGVVKEYLKEYKEAIDAFQTALLLSENAQTYNALARVYLRLSEKSKAREALVMARKLNPKGRDAQEMLEILDEESKSLKSQPVVKKAVSKKHPKTKKRK